VPFLSRKAKVVVAAGLVLLGCNRAPAEEALAEAEQTLEGARTHIEEFAPERLAALERSVQEARVALGAGRYTDALRMAQELPGQIHDAIEAADRRELAAALAPSSSRSAPREAAPSPVPGE
jgi:hypothetical protein